MRRSTIALLTLPLLTCSKLDDGLAVGPLGPPTASIAATQDTIQSGQSVTITVSSTGASDGYLSPPGVPILNGSVDVAPDVSTTYLFAVTGPGGVAYASTTVVVEGTGPPRPTVTLDADPTTILPGETVTLTVTSQNADLGLVVPTNTPVLNGDVTDAPEFTTTYVAMVSGPGGSAFASVTVEVVQPEPPTVSLTASADTIELGETVTLTVATSGADQALVVPTNATVLNGDITDTPGNTTTYLAMVEGPGGSAFASATVVVVQPPPAPAPTATIEATPASILPGETATLVVTSTDADEGYLAPLDIPLLNESVDVTPEVTTTYVYEATGAGGTAYAATTVVVETGSTVPAPTVTLTADQTTIDRGESVTLTIASENAASALTVPTDATVLNGDVTDTPEVTTTYLTIVEGPGGSAFASVTVEVIQPSPPTVTLTASADTIDLDESVTLTVASTDADDVLVVPTNATVLNGDVTDTPEFTTTYLAIAQGPGGSAFASVTVVVIQPDVPGPPRPTATIEATPSQIDSGDAVVLTVSSTDADLGLLVPSAISILNGDVTLTPDRTTTYLFAVSGAGGAAFDAVTVFVGETPPPPPTAAITAVPATILVGEESVLTVTSTGGYLGTISPIGVSILNGDVTVMPADTTTYVFTVEGLGGTAQDSIRVHVN